jgi:hypothetical protein
MQKVTALKPGTLVHVMCVPAKGADVSVEIACEVQARGYDAVPHITARTVIDRSHLARLAVILDPHNYRLEGVTQTFPRPPELGTAILEQVPVPGPVRCPDDLCARDEAHSPAGSRAPRTVITAIPKTNTSPAQMAAPRSCGGLAGQSHGVVSAGPCHCVYSP